MILVKDIMTIELFTLNPYNSLRQAKKAMTERRIRHIPIVTEGDWYLGLLSQQDVLDASVSRLANLNSAEKDDIEASIPVNEIMQTSLHTVLTNTPLEEAGVCMLEHKLSCLPVVENGIIRGIVTESDFVRIALSFLGMSE